MPVHMMTASAWSIRRSKYAVLLIVLPTLCTDVSAQCGVDVNTVGAHIGEHVVFSGYPIGVKCTGTGADGPAYIDFGGPYPAQAFSIVLPANVIKDDCRALHARYEGHLLRMAGTVILHQGKAAMFADAAADIIVENDPSPH